MFMRSLPILGICATGQGCRVLERAKSKGVCQSWLHARPNQSNCSKQEPCSGQVPRVALVSAVTVSVSWRAGSLKKAKLPFGSTAQTSERRFWWSHLATSFPMLAVTTPIVSRMALAARRSCACQGYLRNQNGLRTPTHDR